MSAAPPIPTNQVPTNAPVSVGPPTNLGPVNTYPIIDPQFQADLDLWLEAMADVQKEYAEIKQMAAHLKTHTTDMYQIIVIMNLMQEPTQSKVQAQSDLLNLDTDMRNQINAGQSAYNGISNSASGWKPGEPLPAKAVDAANALVQAMAQVQAELKLALGNGAIDPATFKSINDAINSLKSAFGDGSWGDPSTMADDIMRWVINAGDGTNIPQINTILSSFTNQLQTVGAWGGSTNTQLQFLIENAKTLLGAWQTTMQSELKMTSALVKAQVST